MPKIIVIIFYILIIFTFYGGLSSTDTGYFDIVIGNPPYIDIKSLAKKDVDYYFSNFETPQNRINIYAVFIEKSIQILKFTGVLSFIIPNSLLINSSYEKTRRYIGNKVDCILKLPDGIFENAIVETIIIKIRNNKLEDTVRAKVFPNKSFISLNNIEYSKYSVKEWKNDQEFRFNIFQSKESVDILLKIEKKSKYNLDDIADFSLGITPYDKYKGHSENMIKNKVFHSKKQLDHTYKPLISGKNIKRYVVDEKTDEYIKYGNWLGAPREERFFISPRLIVRQIIANNPMRIFCAYTEQPLYFTQIGFSIITRNEFYPNFVLLALLNSELLNFYHTHRFLDTEKNVFQKILIANCKKIPIPFISDKVLNQLELLVKSVIKSINEEQEIDTIENEINSLVYKLYDLSYNDIKVINSDFSLSAQDYNAIEV